MSLLGVHLTLLMGPTAPLPAPPMLVSNLSSVEVTSTDSGRSGFQISFEAGRSGAATIVDEPLLSLPQLQVFSRVIIMVTLGARPRVLMDGIITNQEYDPGDEPGAAMITVTGEDVSVMMDREERIVEHPALPPTAIVARLVLGYARYGLRPTVIPPKVVDAPLPVERTPVQHGTDLSYIEELARRAGHVFYIEPGPLPFTSSAYWGPPRRVGIPQNAVSLRFGVASNVSSISFRHDGMAPTFVNADVQDKRTNLKLPVRTFASTRFPFALRPTWLAHRGSTATSLLDGEPANIAGAFGQAQAQTDLSNDQVVTASGELDALTYGDVLRSRGTVGLRGAGRTYDGLYYVKEVTHSIRKGEYKQSFTLTREGVGTTVPAVLP